MVDFLYFGEANVNQDRLDVFLALAEELKLKGLTNSSEKNVEDAEMEPAITEKKLEQKLQYDTSTLNEAKPLEIASSNTTRMSSLGALVNTEPDQFHDDDHRKTIDLWKSNKGRVPLQCLWKRRNEDKYCVPHRGKPYYQQCLIFLRPLWKNVQV